jgi:RHS repeat-associated protein
MTRKLVAAGLCCLFSQFAYSQLSIEVNADPAKSAPQEKDLAVQTLAAGSVDVTSKSIEDRRFKPPSDAVGVLGPDMFGDQTDHNTGSTSFTVTDIDVPGNSSLPVRLSRSMRVAVNDFAPPVPLGGGPLNSAGWEIEVPHISGIFASGSGTIAPSNPAGASPPLGWAADSSTPLARCSTGSGRPPINGVAINILSATYFWSGTKINIPGGTSGDLLLAQSSTQNASTPARWTTKDHWLISCLPTIVNGSGEGFLATSPDGTKYTFNRMVVTGGFLRYTRMYSTTWGSMAYGNSGNIYLYRNKYHLVATKAEDRFGNVVNYNYDANNRLTSITGSDGRSITITRNTSGVITGATAHGRSWTYAYLANGKLASVTQPDSRQWLYSETGFRFQGAIEEKEAGVTLYSGELCTNGVCYVVPDNQYTGVDHNSSVTITHPSGAQGVFSFRAHEFFNPWELNGNFEEDKPLSYVDSIISKSINAAGMPAPQTWSYQYDLVGTSLTNVSCQQGLCPSSRATAVTQPDGRVLSFAFRLDGHPAGRDQLISETTFKNVVQVSKTTYENVVADSAVGFTTRIGFNPVGTPTVAPSEYDLPQKRKIVEQDGVTYTWLANSFDWLGRANSVTRSNSNGFSKTEQSVFSDDTTKWVLGQLTSVTDTGTGLVEQSISYDPVSRLITSRSQFGQLQGTFTWNANGTLATAKDAKNNTTTLSNYKAGNPQRVDFADGSFETGVFNNFGWLTSMTNARGYVSGFGYDTMGRLSSITPPTGDAVAWAGTTLTFTPLTTATYGVPAGGWKHTISRGNYRKETYMDALYRPLVVREYDNANVAGTQRFTTKAYDTLNREVFSAYPGVTATLTAGTRTTYDALGRVIENKADSELGVLTTTTEYLSGGGIKVTGPDGQITTRTFRSLDAPSYEQMISEAAPGGVTTSISRDVFGKPLTITRSGTDGLSISKQFAYDSAQRLCMRTEPETGTSIIDYDAAGNVLWAANGQAVANPAVCERTAALAGAKINYSYDALNRITSTDVPGSTNDPTVTYYPDGSVNTLSNGSAVWSYTYNRLGKPVTETLTMGTRVNTITHAYDTLANQASLTYPSGSNIAYLPNALGQATQAGTYVTGMTYRASGFLTGMSYGNGATYSALPNLRGLPARRLDQMGVTVITDELIGYDQDANPVCVRDSSTGNPGHRDFTYDVRDRLIKASAPNQGWISAEYQYDSQDNLKLARLGTRQYNHSLNALNQLASITQPSTAPGAANYGLGTCADASLAADLGNGSTGPSVAIPTSGTPGTATTGGAQTAKYSFSHDAEGRMTAKGTQAYVYDALNRMTQVTGKESYLYDGHGRRVQTTKTSDGSINYPLYSLDGKLILEDNRQTLQRIEYIHAGGRLVAKRIQPITAAGANNGTATTTTIHTDFLGSPVAETNAAGAVTRVERYTPYGEPADMQLDAGPGFTGHATDVATGLTYMQQRYYDPEIGRFISPDPVGPEEDFIKHFNRYNYALNNPVRYTDPDGRQSRCGVSCDDERADKYHSRQKPMSGNEGYDEERNLRRIRAEGGAQSEQRAEDVGDYLVEEAVLYFLPVAKLADKLGGFIKGLLKGTVRSIDDVKSLRGAKYADVEKMADAKFLNMGWTKSKSNDGNGIKWINGKGGFFMINKGTPGGKNGHGGPYINYVDGHKKYRELLSGNPDL